MLLGDILVCFRVLIALPSKIAIPAVWLLVPRPTPSRPARLVVQSLCHVYHVCIYTKNVQEDLFGQGPVCASCHVMITKEYMDKIEPPLEGEISLLEVSLCECRVHV